MRKVLILSVGMLVASIAFGMRTARSRAAVPVVPAYPATQCQDADHDGFGIDCRAGPDCNDLDPAIHASQVETCNFRDDDCDGLVDENAGCSSSPLGTPRVLVSAGVFLMGSDNGADDERPVHRVQLSRYQIDRYEVTNRRYRDCVHSGACSRPVLASSSLRKEYFDAEQFDDYPVVFVDWQQADAFCRFAGGRLPTEAEWEKAARGSVLSERTYPWGEEEPTCAFANMGGPAGCVGDTDRVGRRLLGASPYGAEDMAGNVWEWVSDWYDPGAYQGSRPTDPVGPSNGSLKVMRGGCWASSASSLRVSCRKAELPSTWAPNVGFRCAYPEGR